jgi:hypothetical protein
MTAEQTFVIVGASQSGAKAARTLRHQGFEGRPVLVGTEHERRTSVPGCRSTTCAARPDAGASTCTARASTPTTTSCTWAERRHMNTTLREIALDVMPQQNNGIPVAEHPLERSAS